jgi:hypothetical protein
MATRDDYLTQKARLADLEQIEIQARLKSFDMHGGNQPHPHERPMPTIITQCGTWAVTPEGIECLVYPYEIQWDSITDPITDDEYWLSNLAKKDWVNLKDFADALHHGRKIHRFLKGVSTNNTLPEDAEAL